MSSLRSQVIIFLLQHRHWFRLRLKRETVDWNTSIPAWRERVEKLAGRFGRIPPGIEVLPVVAEQFRAEWVRPVQSQKNRAILYFHGGGYVMGSSRSHRGIVAKFVAGSNTAALVVDYRLAPEHPFPAAIEDSLAAYTWLLSEGVPPSGIAFVGDSAGGGLCLAAMLAARERGLPMPAAAVALSPWTDLKCTGDSYRREDPLAPSGSWQVFGRYYAGEQDLTLPLISPLYGELAGLPPLLLYAGENESMLDDATQFAAKAARSGVDVRLHVGQGMVHCYPALSPLFREAREAMDDICAFLRRQTSSPPGTGSGTGSARGAVPIGTGSPA